MFLDWILFAVMHRPHVQHHRPEHVSRSERRPSLRPRQREVVVPLADMWDRIAACESGGNWHINTGNGFSGGLQFTPTTWRSFGGLKFAWSAYLATKGQQMTVANRVLVVQGLGAWPVCGAQ